MNNQPTLERLESFLTLLFAISVFVWKPGMYVSSGLITLYLLTRPLIDHAYGQMVWNHPITKVSLGIFVLGLCTAAIGAQELQDLAWMARKTLFIPVVVFFLFALTKQRNRTLAMTGLIGSFWIASLVTLNNYDWQFNFGSRMEGPWPQGTWDSLLGLFFTFMVVSFKWTGTTHLKRAIHLVTTLMALLMLVLAGGRAPWIGAILSLAIYFVVFNRNKRLLLSGIAAAVVVAILAGTVFEQKTQPIVDRFSTVFNTTTEGSNWIRLQLWQIGIAHLIEFAQNDPVELLFGGGAQSYDDKQREFFKTMPFDEADRARLIDYGYPTGDTHNTYIDNALRHGVIWTVLMTLYLIWLCTRFSWRAVKQNPRPFTLVSNLLVVGIFYTVVPHFVTLFFVLFWAMLDVRQTDSQVGS